MSGARHSLIDGGAYQPFETESVVPAVATMRYEATANSSGPPCQSVGTVIIEREKETYQVTETQT